MATDAASLMKDAATACNECYGSNPYGLQLMTVALLRQWVLALNPSAMLDAQSLLDQAKCYQCYSANPYTLQLLIVACSLKS